MSDTFDRDPDPSGFEERSVPLTAMQLRNAPLKPCRSPYCECDEGKCTHPGFYDAGSEPIPVCPYCERAHQMLEAHGVSRTRSKYVSNGIDVLATRLQREIVDLRAYATRLAAELARYKEREKTMGWNQS